jgi:hypothetical protein
MVWLLNLLHVVGLCLSLSFAARQPTFDGRVITESGAPLPGATVLLVRKGGGEVEMGILSQTDEAGVFHLKTAPDALFVQKEGYLPQLYRVDGIPGNPLVVMKAADQHVTFSLVQCSDSMPMQKTQRVGLKGRITILEETKIKVSRGVDASFIEISYSGKEPQTLTISSGGVFLGYPHVDALAETKDIIVHPAENGTKLDISGTMVNGKHWRWAFIGGTHIEYYDASAEAADVFDHLIASMCGVGQASAPPR